MRPSLLAAGESIRCAGVGRAHLEEDAHLELAERLAVEVAVQVVHAVAPDDHVDAQAGPVAEDRVELVGGAARPRSRAREAEVVVAAAEVAEPRQVVDEEEELGAVGGVGLLPALDLGGQLGEDPARRRASRRPSTRVGQDAGDPREGAGLGMVLGRAVEDGEPRARRGPCRRPRGRTGRPGSRGPRPMTPSAASSFWPTISRLLPLWRRKTAAVGSLIAIASPSQAWADRGRLGPGRGVEQRG